MNHLLARKSTVRSNPLLTWPRGSHRITACVLALVLALGLLPSICQGQPVAPSGHHPQDPIARQDPASADKVPEITTESQKGYDPADACAQLRRQCIYAAEDRSGLMGIMCRPPLSDVTDDQGRTPLMMAVEGGYIELTAFLLNMTENVNAKDHSGDTAIIYAAVLQDHPNTQLIKMLLEHGAEMSLFVAAALGDEQEARRLIRTGADVNAKTGGGFTPLLIALQSRHPGMAKLLLGNGADVNAENSNGATPLWEACGWGYQTIKKLLMARGAKMTLPLAVRLDDGPEVRRLIDAGANVNTKGVRGETALHLATKRGSAKLVKYLIEKGADINARNVYGSTPLIEAVVRGRFDLVTLLTERGADVNARTKNGLTPLAALGWVPPYLQDETPLLAIAKYLMNKGAEVNFDSHDTGLTPLMQAARGKRPKLVKLLIDRGADVNARSRCLKTVHLLAVLDCPFEVESARSDEAKHGGTSGVTFWASNRPKVRQWLITFASMISKNFDDGITPLMLAVDEKDVESVRLLIAAGADVNAKTTYNNKTALHTALGYEVSKTLIQHGADVNAQTSVGGTPLMRAAKNPGPGDINQCKLFVEHGANVNLRSRDGHTALDLAYGRWKWNEEVVKYLKSKGAVSGLKHLQERDDLSKAN